MRRTTPVEPFEPIEPDEPLSHAIKGRAAPWANHDLNRKTRLMAGFLSGGTIWVRTGDLFDVSEAL